MGAFIRPVYLKKKIKTKEFYLILYQTDELSHKLFNELANEIKYKTQKDTATAP
jgi:hypothetical protein